MENSTIELKQIMRDISAETDNIKKQIERNREVVPFDSDFCAYSGTSASDSSGDMSVQQMFLLDGEEFLKAAYRQCLKREAGQADLEIYLPRLENGELSKEDIVYYLCISEEGEKKEFREKGIVFHRLQLSQLMSKNGEEFISNAYHWILDREPDEKGKEDIGRALSANQMTKEEVLYSMLQSEEAKARAVSVPGLKKVCQRRKIKRVIKRIPLLGSLAGKLYRFVFTYRILTERCNELERNLSAINKRQVEQLELEKKKHEPGSVEAIGKEVLNYFDFENNFRGSREHIKKVQQIYLPYYAGCHSVLDLGCGRGEFTELLTENGIGVMGVDIYAPFVEYVKSLHLPVTRADAFQYLSQVEETDGVFMGQVVEHLPIETTIAICKTAYEKLKEGQYLIMESPNPLCLMVFTNTFYVDPTHQRPVHPYTLRYICEKIGFSSVQILFTDSSKVPIQIPAINADNEEFAEFNRVMKQVSTDLYGSQDYAIIARK